MSKFQDRLPNRTTPLSLARQLLSFTPDETQSALLTTQAPYVLLNCHRQWGKTTLTAVRALHQATSLPDQNILVISPTLRQSRLLTNRCRDFARRLNLDFSTDGANPCSLRLPNGSLVLALPAHPDHARGFSAHLLIIDEAARVSDDVFSAVTPLIAATQGHLWLLSTPRGKRGFFYRESIQKDSPAYEWHRLTAPAAGPHGSGRLPAPFLAAEKKRKTAQQFAEEYLCDFTTAERNVFSEDSIARAITPLATPFDEISRALHPHLPTHPFFIFGLDFGKQQDHSALTLLDFRAIPTGTRDAATWQHLYRRQLHLRLIERFPLGTPFHQVLARVARLAEHPLIKHHAALVFDSTGLGLPLREQLELMRLPLHLVPINITSGQSPTVTPQGRNVPKTDLVQRLELLLEQNYLKIAAHAPQVELLREELLHFERQHLPGGRVTFSARGTHHDDLVMSAALAGWWAWDTRKSLLLGPPHKPLSLW